MSGGSHFICFLPLDITVVKAVDMTEIREYYAGYAAESF
jgi:hypothetical protein